MAVNSMEFNGVRPAPIIQFGLAGDLRLGWRKLNIRRDSCKQPTGKQDIGTKVRPASCNHRHSMHGLYFIRVDYIKQFGHVKLQLLKQTAWYRD